MRSCCRSAACEQMFTAGFARRSLKRYREKGLDELERALVEGALEGGVAGATVLEVGGGIGAIQAELLAAGAERGEVLELVGAYEPYARELAEDHGLGERTRFRVLDLLSDPAAADPADVVVLNRVVCCSPDGVELASVAASLARSTLVLSYPRDAWWVRAGIRALNAVQWLLRRSFRAFVHAPGELTAAARRWGLEPTRTGGGLIWEYTIMRRAS